ncbi:MAG TPA: hypothetical protein VGD83_24265, partial [Streptosporangiaceae bacterium]
PGRPGRAARLETVTGQIADLIVVLRAEQARRRAGIEIHRPAWKNLIFTGGPGKSRAARALAAEVIKPRGAVLLITGVHLARPARPRPAPARLPVPADDRRAPGPRTSAR